MSYLCERQVSGLEPETSRPLFALSCCMWFIKSHFLLFSWRSPNWAIPANTVSGIWTHNVNRQKILRLPRLPIAPWPQMVHRLIRSMHRLYNKLRKKIQATFHITGSTSYCLRSTLHSFSSACPIEAAGGTQLSSFQNTDYRRMTSCRNRTDTMRNARQNILIPTDLTGRWL